MTTRQVDTERKSTRRRDKYKSTRQVQQETSTWRQDKHMTTRQVHAEDTVCSRSTSVLDERSTCQTTQVHTERSMMQDDAG